MMVFAVVTWVLFGLTIGGMVAFFMERRAHTVEHVIAGIGGAFLGGMLGMMLGALVPALDWNVNGYSIPALVLAIGLSAIFAVVERSWHRRGRVILSDPRPGAP